MPLSRDAQLDELVVQTQEWSTKATQRLTTRQARLKAILEARGVTALASPLADKAVDAAKKDLDDL